MEKSLIEGCGFCQSRDLRTIIDFGSVGLAGAFLKPENFAKEKIYPMHLVLCESCHLLQVAEHVPPSEIFGPGYFYYSSSIQTLRDHFRAYAHEMLALLEDKEQNLVIEIGCNDGILLEPLAELGCKNLIGIDPSTNVLQKIANPVPTLINDFFSLATARAIVEKNGPASLIMANNVFAHISDIRGFVQGIYELLAPEGVFVFEVHYMRNLIEDCQYDMIYHEHLYNYSLTALQQFFLRQGLEVFDLKEIPIHAGSMRYLVKKVGSKRGVSSKVGSTLAEESSLGYDRTEAFLRYGEKVASNRRILLEILDSLRNERKKRIVGYGASGRANTILQYCDFNSNHLDYIVDDAPAKQGFYTPRTHIEIRSRAALLQDKPDYVLCFAWSFMDEIARKNLDYLKSGGIFIAPLPEPEFLYMDYEGKIIKNPWKLYLDLTKDTHASIGLGQRRDARLNP